MSPSPVTCATHDHRVAPRHRPVQVHDDAGRAASLPDRAGRISLQVPHAGRRPDAVRRRDRARDRRLVRLAVSPGNSTTCAAGASSRAILSICWACFTSTSALSAYARRGPPRARSRSRSWDRGCTRSSSRCRSSPSSARCTSGIIGRARISPKDASGCGPRSHRSTQYLTRSSGSRTTARAAVFRARGRTRSCAR